MTEVYEVRGRRLGVRWTRAGLDAELRALCTSALGIQDAPGNISIVVGDSVGGARSKHQLHAQGHLLNTIAGDGNLIRAIVRALAALAADPLPGAVSLNAFLVVDPGVAAVAVDRRLEADVFQVEPLLRRRGRRLLTLPRLDVWPDRGTAALSDAAAALGVSVEALDARWPLRPGDDDLAGGEVAITQFVYAGLPEPESRADVVAAMVPMAQDPTGRIARTAVAQLAVMSNHVKVDGVVGGGRNRLATVLGLS